MRIYDKKLLDNFTCHQFHELRKQQYCSQFALCRKGVKLQNISISFAFSQPKDTLRGTRLDELTSVHDM